MSCILVQGLGLLFLSEGKKKGSFKTENHEKKK